MIILNFKIAKRISKFVSIFCLSLFFLFGCQPQEKNASLQRIIERGYISVGTIYGLTSYYLEAEGAAGFEYELVKKYADSLGVELKVVPSYSLEDLFDKLDNGTVDILAAGLAVTDKRRQLYNFSPSYDNISQKLVFCFLEITFLVYPNTQPGFGLLYRVSQLYF